MRDKYEHKSAKLNYSSVTGFLVTQIHMEVPPSDS